MNICVHEYILKSSTVQGKSQCLNTNVRLLHCYSFVPLMHNFLSVGNKVYVWRHYICQMYVDSNFSGNLTPLFFLSLLTKQSTDTLSEIVEAHGNRAQFPINRISKKICTA